MHDKVTTESQVQQWAHPYMRTPGLHVLGNERVPVSVAVHGKGTVATVAIGYPADNGAFVDVLVLYLASLDQIRQLARDILRDCDHRQPEWDEFHPQEDEP